MNLDVRRVWECPECGRRVKRQGDVTSYSCPCREPPIWMRLVESQRENREYEPYIVPEIQADELLGDEEPTPSETHTLKEPAAVVETVQPAEIEAPPSEEEEFYSPEEENEDNPSATEPTASEPAVEPTVSEPDTEKPAEPAAQEKPRRGKPRRRRSGRKRSRGQGSQEGGGETG